MKYLALLSCLALSSAIPQRRLQPVTDQQPAEQNYNNYNNQNNDYNNNQNNDYNGNTNNNKYQPQDFRQQKTVQDDLRNQIRTTTWIPIIRFDKEQGTDGSYKTSYETGNHILAEETGFLKPVGENQEALVQHGQYSYTAPDGQVIAVEYTADEFGFRVKGDHIPTPPPVSPEIQKGLDQIYAGIKANAERAAKESNDPERARSNQQKAELDYKGLYYPQ